MLLISTQGKKKATLKEAVLQGLARDGGLFMPAKIPKLPAAFFRRAPRMSLQEISFEVARAFFKGELPDRDLRKIVEDSIDFPAPLVKLTERYHVLELFHGPTLAFKDFGARFMARLMSHFRGGKNLTILVATSGDTGSAVASGFYKVPGIRVVILYPSGRISEIQEKQITTWGANITAVEVKGVFDDCQRLVKQAFMDSEINGRLTSANSINIARLIPQSFFFFWGQSRLGKPVVFSVPSGNFGNLTAGLMAKRMGLPVGKFVAATNVNDVVPKYLASENFEPAPSKQTISSAMDVGNPSNFARMLALYANADEMRRDVWAASCTDDETRAAIREVYAARKYVLDPHGAVGYVALKKFFAENSTGATAIILETAHPAKFPEDVEPLTGRVKAPARLQKCLRKRKRSVVIPNSYGKLREILSGL